MKSNVIFSVLVASALATPAVVYSQGAPGTGKQETVGEKVDDSLITTKIKAEMAKDKTVSAMNIKVDTDKGVVQLSGIAKSKVEAQKAEIIARNTKGVTNVKNDIVVQVN